MTFPATSPDPAAVLAWLARRRSVRAFSSAPVAREVLDRLLRAATTAPSATNRQPWRFAVVTGERARARLVAAVRARTAALEAVIRRGPHADEFGRYGDFFHEPLAAAPAVIIPQHRTYPDLLASFYASGGGAPADLPMPGEMQPELCAASAAVMLLLVQAHAEGLGACWMAGPMVARPEIEALLGIRAPWRMMGAIALGHPATAPTGNAPDRRPAEAVAAFFDDSSPADDRAKGSDGP